MFKESFLITLTVINFTYSARILCFFIVPSYSHQQFLMPICKELSLRGHQVVITTSFPLKDPTLVNLTEIDTTYTLPYYNAPGDSRIQALSSAETKGPNEIPTNLFNLLSKLVELIFEDENFQRVYQNPNEHFDLIIAETVIPTVYGLGGRFKAPVIGACSLDGWYSNHAVMGNIINPSLYSDMMYSDYGRSFKSRFFRLLYYIWFQYHYYWQVLPAEDRKAKKYLGDDLPSLGDLEKNVSMYFVNGVPILSPIRPSGVTTLYLTQMHIKPLKELPNNLQKILDEAKQGVIYFSLGSTVRSSSIDKNLFKIISQDLSELPFVVLWKWEVDDFPEKPKNIITRKWFPQQDILAHPNVKVFVTQGGLQSLEEAIIRGVPIVGMPFIVDQPMNIDKMVMNGLGLKVDPFKIERNHLKSAILEVAQNDKYRRNILEVRNWALDQPMTGLEKAVWWSEYVIRHKGTQHLKNPTADIPLYQYLFLDVITLVAIILYLLITLAKCLTKLLAFKKLPSICKMKVH